VPVSVGTGLGLGVGSGPPIISRPTIPIVSNSTTGRPAAAKRNATFEPVRPTRSRGMIEGRRCGRVVAVASASSM
jgi:hypothetical protein